MAADSRSIICCDGHSDEFFPIAYVLEWITVILFLLYVTFVGIETKKDINPSFYSISLTKFIHFWFYCYLAWETPSRILMLVITPDGSCLLFIMMQKVTLGDIIFITCISKENNLK